MSGIKTGTGGVQQGGLGPWLARTWTLSLMRLDRAFPLAVKVMVPVTAAVVVVIALAAWTEYRDFRQRSDEMFVERGMLLTRALQADGVQGHFPEHPGDSADLQAHIEKLVAMEPSLLRVNIYAPTDQGPRVVASSDRALIGREAEPSDALPLSTGSTVTEETRLGDEKALEVLAPLQSQGETVASLGLYMSLAERDAIARGLAIRAIAVSVAAALAVLMLIWLIVRLLVVRRLQKLAQVGRRLQEGDLPARVEGSWEPPGRDEMAMVISQFNRMASSLESAIHVLERQAIVDGLTGLFNRRHFERSLYAEIERAKRWGDSLALLMLDVDHFKRFNDTFGHQAGDQALVRISETVQRNLRPMDTAARYGGEEIVVILPGADAAGARTVAERLRKAVSLATVGDSSEMRFTISIGVAVYPQHADSPVELVRKADEALYAAKLAGRDRVRLARGSREPAAID